MELTTYLAISFTIGVFAGCGMFALYIIYHAKQIFKKTKEQQEVQRAAIKKETARLKKEIASKQKKTEDIQNKLEEAGQIIEAQNQIAAAVQQPSANAIHSRHKNKLTADWHTLEEKKREIFNNILAAGADPIISVYDDNIKRAREMKLSDLVSMMNAGTNAINDIAGNKLRSQVDKDTVVKKVVKNGKTFHIIENKGNKTEH